MTWSFAFPYCPNEPIRVDAFEVVTEFYSRHFPDVPHLVHSATELGQPFLRAKTRNELVRLAEQEGHEIVCLVDADTIVHPDELRRALDVVEARDDTLGKPFLRGVNLALYRQRALAGRPLDELERAWPRAQFPDPGAVWIVRTASWWAAGGMDEAFIGWGGEDEAFCDLFAALVGPIRYGRLAAVKTMHHQPRWRADPHWDATNRRQLVTMHVRQHPELVAEWLRVRDQPGIVGEWIGLLDEDTRKTMRR